MIGLVKKCRNLKTDRYGHDYCASSHICYRTVFESNIFVTVLHLGAYIYTIKDEQNEGK